MLTMTNVAYSSCNENLSDLEIRKCLHGFYTTIKTTSVSCNECSH